MKKLISLGIVFMFLSQAKQLMMNKNHDYDEAWRTMRMESYTDLILMKIYRTKQIEDNSGKGIAEKLEISGQTLLIVKGERKINLTNEGFLYALNNPDKFKSIIKEKVDALLKL